MGKAAITTAIQSYLSPENSGIPYLGTVYTALPKVANEQDLYQNTFPGLGLGATIYMFFTGQHEERIALGGPHNGHKMVFYQLGLLIVFKSDLAKTVDGQAAFDEFIDALIAIIRDSRTAGSTPSTGGGVVWQWGEGGSSSLGGPDVVVEYTVPKTIDGGVTLFQAVMRLSVLEDVFT